ncbi:MAG: hypothetical protein WD824_22415 [Cyclobacteriaceae bacterium]
MLQDKYLAVADVCKKDSIDIRASIDKIFPIVEELNFKNSKVIYWLFKLRGLPVPESLTLKGLEKMNFVRLETRPGREIIIGLIGQFWTITGGLKRFKPEAFTSYSNTNNAKATWSFELVELTNAMTRLTTETRVLCPTQKAKARFMFYWTIVRPFSAWIRKEILKSIKKQAES